jgi:hypothetical protein
MEFPNRIKLNDRYSISVQPDKMIITGFFSDPNIHLTISYGIKSGIVDLHLTKNNKNDQSDHYKILNISHLDLIKIFPILLNNLFNSFFENQRELDINWLKMNNFKAFPLSGFEREYIKSIDANIDSFMKDLNNSKRRFNINSDSEYFIEQSNNISNKFTSYYQDNQFSPEVITEIVDGYGLLISESEILLFYRNVKDIPKKEFISDNLNVSLQMILSKTLGEDVYDIISQKITEALNIFSKDYKISDIDDNAGLTIRVTE